MKIWRSLPETLGSDTYLLFVTPGCNAQLLNPGRQGALDPICLTNVICRSKDVQSTLRSSDMSGINGAAKPGDTMSVFLFKS